ncbi:response regulator [Geminicoccus flavidas]|uniref:response regulator n=1 Tax=Geminicoccus flavidas TaxID=2506407 RepID=UPI001F216EDF|nr:response regulator transcription factor [Geminicoccus flavidas]
MRMPSAAGRILLVEDDAEIAELLAATLTENGFTVTTVGCGPDMDRLLDAEPIDLIVLDVMLPGEDGFSICRRLRAQGPVPIIMVTALGQDIDRVVGLELGADDYVTKPFSSRELLARIRALLRRADLTAQSRTDAARLRFLGWRIDRRSRTVLDPDGTRVTMTTAEFDLLVAFCQHPGRVLTREELLGLTHGRVAGTVERSIDVHVSRLRQKIEPDPRDPVVIKTVRLGGYLFTPLVAAEP